MANRRVTSETGEEVDVWECPECNHLNYWRLSSCWFCDHAAPKEDEFDYAAAQAREGLTGIEVPGPRRLYVS